MYGNKPFDKEIHKKYLQHEKIENLKGLEVELIYEWEVGSMLIFDRQPFTLFIFSYRWKKNRALRLLQKNNFKNMLKKKFLKFLRSLIKNIFTIYFKIFIKLKVNRRVINYLQEKSYFSNERYNFSEKLNYLLKNEKLIALDVGAQGGFNSDNFFPKRYKPFFDCIMVEPIKSEAEKIKNEKYIITKALWSKKERKKFFILDKRLGSSSMFKPDREKFDLHDIKKKEFENYDVTRTIELECDTLENSLKSLNIKNLDYLKIDTQGAELEILKGLENIARF